MVWQAMNPLERCRPRPVAVRLRVLARTRHERAIGLGRRLLVVACGKARRDPVRPAIRVLVRVALAAMAAVSGAGAVVSANPGKENGSLLPDPPPHTGRRCRGISGMVHWAAAKCVRHRSPFLVCSRRGFCRFRPRAGLVLLSVVALITQRPRQG